MFFQDTAHRIAHTYRTISKTFLELCAKTACTLEI